MIFNFFNTYVLYPLAEKKMGRDIRGKISTLQQEAKLSAAEREKLIQKKLHQVLIVAGQAVPYYRDLFQEIEFSPDSVLRDLKYLHEIPYLTKEIILEQNRGFDWDFNLNLLRSTRPRLDSCGESLRAIIHRASAHRLGSTFIDRVFSKATAESPPHRTIKMPGDESHEYFDSCFSCASDARNLE
jgi:hypothetical protein